MNDLLELFANSLLPIVLVAAAGFFLQRLLGLDPRSLAQVVFYVFIPALLFSLLVSSSVEALETVRMIGFAALVMTTVCALAILLGRVLRLTRSEASALILTATFMNSGNFGLPLCRFALGNQGLALASLFYVTSSMLNNSVGAYVSDAGHTTAAQALRGLARVPAVYAILLALLVRATVKDVPLPIWRPIELLGSAAIPTMLLLLGMQIGRVGWTSNWRLIGVSTGLRLIASPLVALLLAPLVGLDGIAAKAGILEAAMPTALLNGILAIKFDLEPDAVAACTLISTVISPLTLGLLLAYLAR